MTSALPTILAGNLPPAGRGVYARAQSVDWLARFDFVCLLASRGDTRTKGIELRRRSVEVWLYDTPVAWTPESDHVATVARMDALAADIGAKGCIADPENGWMVNHQAVATPEQARALAVAIGASVKAGHRWGVTSFASMYAPFIEAWKASGAWGSPQLYEAGNNAPWLTKWESIFGPSMVLMGVGLWHFRDYPDIGAYKSYLASLPACRGAIGWTDAFTTDDYVTAFREWEPWHNIAIRLLLALRAYASTPLGIAALALLAFLILGVVIYRLTR